MIREYEIRIHKLSHRKDAEKNAAIIKKLQRKIRKEQAHDLCGEQT